MKGKRNWKYRPVVWAIVFGVFDVVWLLLIHLTARMTDYSDLKLDDDSFGMQLTTMWNVAHKPIRTIIEPILFPIVTSHPPTPSDGVFFLYEALSVLQFVIIGYIVGLVVSRRWDMRC